MRSTHDTQEAKKKDFQRGRTSSVDNGYLRTKGEGNEIEE